MIRLALADDLGIGRDDRRRRQQMIDLEHAPAGAGHVAPCTVSRHPER